MPNQAAISLLRRQRRNRRCQTVMMSCRSRPISIHRRLPEESQAWMPGVGRMGRQGVGGKTPRLLLDSAAQRGRYWLC